MTSARSEPRRASIAALLLGLVGSTLIWISSPYTDHVIFTGLLDTSYLPATALVLILFMVVVVNPLLRRWRPGWALDRSRLALVLSMWLMASVLPGPGTLRTTPFAIANVPREISGNARLAEAYSEAGIRASLFPDRIDGGQPVTVVNDFIGELPEGRPIPWQAWIEGPLWSWGLLYVGLWLMMIGLATVVWPQWRRNELLAFPLLTVQQSLIQDPDEGRLVAPVFRSASFWIAAAAVLLVHLLRGFHLYSPERVPAIPFSWNLLPLFNAEPLSHMPWHIPQGRLFFLLVGIAFFVPTRVTFSIWATVVIAGGYVMLGRAYVPDFAPQVIADYRSGATFAVMIVVLWLGRSRWVAVAQQLFSNPSDEPSRADRRGGWMLLIGAAGLFAWLVWIGRVQPWWAAVFTLSAFMVCLVVTRIVAETGIPFIGLEQSSLVSIIGAHLAHAKMLWLLSPASLFFSYVIGMVVYSGAQMSAATMATHAIGLDDESGGDRPRSSRRVWILLVVLVAGLIIGGAATLHVAYHHAGSADASVVPLNWWHTRALLAANEGLLRVTEHEQSGGAGLPFDVNRFNHPDRLDLGFGHLGAGAIVAGILYWLCLRSPAWPLHPIGLVMIDTWFANRAWPSLFLGWLIKMLVLRYGGAALFERARASFLGLIVGEILAIAFWTLEPTVRVLMGLDYVPVGRG
ncbi:MAG: hypothetical protein CMJ18_22105 [Phycisphaeraceae bacterium]|nr:hypothetical protein [Phycisphaeraceae bacterium]